MARKEEQREGKTGVLVREKGKDGEKGEAWLRVPMVEKGKGDREMGEGLDER